MSEKSIQGGHMREQHLDNLGLTRLLVDLINKYLKEENNEKRKQLFSEMTSLKHIGKVLNKGK